eukprot:6467092-Pyramimonas_sp.AAC.1
MDITSAHVRSGIPRGLKPRGHILYPKPPSYPNPETARESEPVGPRGSRSRREHEGQIRSKH